MTMFIKCVRHYTGLSLDEAVVSVSDLFIIIDLLNRKEVVSSWQP